MRAVFSFVGAFCWLNVVGIVSADTDFGAFDRLRNNASLTSFPVYAYTDGSFSFASYVGRNLHRILPADGAIGEAERSLFEGHEELLFCHIPTMLRYSTWNQDGTMATTTPMTRMVAYSGSVGALLAMHHFNTGNGTVIDDLAGIDERCPLRFTTEVFDTRGSPFEAVKELTKMLTRPAIDKQNPQPCALFGSQSSAVSERLASLAGPYGLPQVSSSAMSTSLNDDVQYPTFARTHTDLAGFGEMSVSYLKNNLEVSNAALFFPNNGYGLSFQASVLEAAASHGVEVFSVPYRPDGSLEQLKESLIALRETGYNYFIGLFEAGGFGTIMNLAGELGVAGPGKFWLASGSAGTAPSLLSGQFRVPKGSGLEKAIQGNGLIFCKGGLPGIKSYDRFTTAWKALGQDSDALAYVNSKQPVPANPDTPPYAMQPGFFQNLPHHDVTFSYDAVVALGLSACELLQEKNDTNILSKDYTLDGKNHRDWMIQRRFLGASGDVVFADKKATRTADSSYFTMANLVPSEFNETHSTFKGSPIPFFWDSNKSSWLPFGQKAFVYADNTSVAPDELPPPKEEMNQITRVYRSIGLFMGCLAMFLSLACLVTTIVMRQDRVIKASQPIFLVMICVGTFLLAATIIPLSIDDGIASEQGCNNACMSTPWLFFIGFVVTFSALFAKTWRINQLVDNAINFRRITVRPQDVMISLIVLLGSNVIILAVWTGVSPLQYERKVLGLDSYDRPSESVGTCVSDQWAPFLVPLIVINVVALLIALRQAYRGRKLDSIFNESEYIGIAILSIFQSFLIGIPLLFIVHDYPTANYFIKVAICFIVSTTTTLLIFVPKILFIRKGGFEANPQRMNPSGNSASLSASIKAELSALSNTRNSKDSSGKPVSGISMKIRESTSEQEP